MVSIIFAGHQKACRLVCDKIVGTIIANGNSEVDKRVEVENCAIDCALVDPISRSLSQHIISDIILC